VASLQSMSLPSPLTISFPFELFLMCANISLISQFRTTRTANSARPSSNWQTIVSSTTANFSTSAVALSERHAIYINSVGQLSRNPMKVQHTEVWRIPCTTSRHAFGSLTWRNLYAVTSHNVNAVDNSPARSQSIFPTLHSPSPTSCPTGTSISPAPFRRINLDSNTSVSASNRFLDRRKFVAPLQIPPLMLQTSCKLPVVG
jgi:hypothetical protein